MGAYRLLFLPFLTGRARDWACRTRASAAFFNARKKVPAYGEFLRASGAQTRREASTRSPMSKEGYVKKYPLEATCQGGRLPTHGAVIDESSGSSGTASNWVRGESERFATRRLIQYSARATFGDEPFILLNAFALGPWATGMNVSMSLVDRCVLKSIGPDAKKVISTLELLGPKYRYVITGYPPFLKSLVDSAKLDWSAYDVCAVVGGEGMSEPLRAALNRCFRKTFSSFGASDLEVNIAVESEFSIALRQAMASSSALASDLCGPNGSLPMAFQYDPHNYLIETDAERNLLFTLNRLENVSPRIRYNIQDRGLVRSMKEVLAVLADHKIALQHAGPRVDLPLLFHWGRQEHAVAFYGCKITPEDVQNAILRTPALADKVGELALHPFEDEQANKRLELWLEMKPGEALPQSTALAGELLSQLAIVNQDFRESIKMVLDHHRPTLKLFEHGTSPLAGQDPRIKKRYIV